MPSSPLSSPGPSRRQALFLADAHLGGFDAATNARIQADVIAVVRHCRASNTTLYLLGDLFDHWMEWPGKAPAFGNALRAELRNYVAEMGPVLTITGNHDNWTLDELASDGCDIEPEYRYLDLDGLKVLVLHGDGLADPAMGLPRPRMHRFLRHPVFVRWYRRLLPPAVGMAGMAAFSRISRCLSGDRPDTDRLDAWVRAHLRDRRADVVIAGHHHHLRDEHPAGGRYLNAGAFYRHRRLVLYANGSFRIVTVNELPEAPHVH